MRDFPYMHSDKTGHAQSKSTKRVCRFTPGFRYVPWPFLWFIALLILSNVILPSHRNTAYAKQNDNSRWDNVKAWKGTVSITGAYQGSTEWYDEITIQDSLSGSVNISGLSGGMGYWLGYGYITGSYSINRKSVDYDVFDCDLDYKITDDNINTIKGSGSITNGIYLSLDNGVYSLSFSDYWFKDIKETHISCTTSTSDRLE